MATIGSSDAPIITTSYTDEFNSKLDKTSVSDDTTLAASSSELVPTQHAVKSYVDSHTTGVSDASTTVKGIVKLAGDLGGTADIPTVPGLASKESISNKSTNVNLGTSDTLYPSQSAVKLYVDLKDSANVKLSGNQSVSGIKTFSSSPIVPTPTTTTQAANLGSVDSIRLGKVSLKNAKVRSFSWLGNGSPNTIYTCPSSKKAMILGLQLRQITTGTVSAMLVSSRATYLGYFYLYNQSVAASSTMSDLMLGGLGYSRNFVMEQTEAISLSLSNWSPYVLTVVEFDSTTDITTQMAQFSAGVNNVVLALPSSINWWYASCLEDSNKQSMLTTQWMSAATFNVAISGIGANVVNAQGIGAAIVTQVPIPMHLPGAATITVTDLSWSAPNERVVWATFYQS